MKAQRNDALNRCADLLAELTIVRAELAEARAAMNEQRVEAKKDQDEQ